MSGKHDSPFSSLEALRDKLPPGTAAPEREVEPTTPRGPARAIVRLERKQRRGKEVTLVEKLGLSRTDLETWCRELKQALGCGGSVENDAIVLQGDLRKRAADTLTKKGVAKVTIAN
jgi:translation initiation factor 1